MLLLCEVYNWAVKLIEKGIKQKGCNGERENNAFVMEK